MPAILHHIQEHVRESVSNLMASKLRSLLTLLGILVGTGSVVALVSSGELATQHALEQFKTLGTDLLAVSIESSNAQGSSEDNSATRFDPKELNRLKNPNSDIVKIAPYTSDYSTISYEGHPIDGGTLGVTQDLQPVIKIQLKSGRFISFLDQQQFFCVIGSGIADGIRQFGVTNPVGEQLRIGSNFFTIVGVARPWPESAFIYSDINNSVLIPLSTSFLLNKLVTIQNIVFKLGPGGDIDKSKSAVTQLLNELMPNSQLFFRSAKELIQSMQKQRETFTLLLSAIGGISLVVGGIGVMNIMLVSVIERRREIGIRMAVGATHRDIALMFLTESVVLAIFGGVLGILIGIIISFAIAELSGWGFRLFLMPPLIGFLVSAFVGVFFGFYPARKASRLNPIETLRSD